MFNGRLLHWDKLQVRCGYQNAEVDSIQMWQQGMATGVLSTTLTSRWDLWSGALTLPIPPALGSQQIGFQMGTTATVHHWDDYNGGGGMAPPGFEFYEYQYFLNFLGTEYTFDSGELTGTFPQSGGCYLEFENFELWMLNTGHWQTQWTAANWFSGDPDGTNALLNAVSGAVQVQSDAPIPMPSMIPVFNGVLDFTGSASLVFNPNLYGYGPTLDGMTQGGNLTGYGACGWRAQQDGVWIMPPVSFLAPDIGGTGDSWTPGFTFGCSSSTTLHELGPAIDLDPTSFLVFGWTHEEFTAVGSIRLMPCGPFLTYRLNEDHEAPIYIGPQDEYFFIQNNNGVGTWTPVLPGYPAAVDMALDTPSALENNILPSSTPPSPCNYGHTLVTQENANNEPFYVEIGTLNIWFTGAGPLGPDDRAAYQIIFADNTVTTMGWLFNGVGQGVYPPMAYLHSPSKDPGFTYWNSVCNPHFSFHFPFQVDITDDPKLVAPMHLQLAKSSWETWNPDTTTWDPAYFKQIQQTYDLDIIPLSKRTQHRVDHIWTPFNSRGLGGMLDNVNAASDITPTTTSLSGFQGSYWWGTTGAKLIIPGATTGASGQVLHVSLNGATSARWTGGAPGFFNLVIPPAGTVANFDLTSWATYPFGWTRIANQIQINALAGSSNIASWKLEMIGEDGSAYTVATDGDGAGTYYLGPGNNAKWSISADMLLGDGTVFDTYQGLHTGDDSPTVYGTTPGLMTSTEKVGDFRAKTLRLTIIPVDPTKASFFPTPTLMTPDAGSMRVVPINSRDSLLMVPNGPSLYIGPQLFWNGSSVIDSPTVNYTVTNGQMSAGDIAALYLSVFLAQQPTASLHAFMEGFFVYGLTGTIEWSLLKHFWSDPFTSSQLTTGFALGPTPCFFMVNSFSFLPPLAMLGGDTPRVPANAWRGGGPTFQVGYSAAATRRYIVAPSNGTPADKVNLIAPANAAPPTIPGQNCLKSDHNDACAGWSPQYFHGRVSNDEHQPDYTVELGTQQYAGIRPWRGMLFSPGAPVGKLQPTMIHDSLGFLHRLHLDANGYVIYDRCLWAPVGGWTQEATLSPSGGHYCTGLAIGLNQRLYAAWDDTGGVTLAYSDSYDGDAGPVTFTTVGIVSPGGRFMMASNDMGTVLLIVRQSDSSLLATRYRTGETQTFTLMSSSANLLCEDAGISLCGSLHPGDPWHMEITKIGDSAPTHWMSTDDGETWKQIT